MGFTTEDAYKLYNDKRFKEAFDALFDAAAYENNHEAQFYLGMMYFHGDGVEKNLDKAVKWWTKARRGGHVDAASRMAEISITTKNMF